VGVYMKFLWGPLCLLAAAATAKGSYNRHALQMLGSMAHIYGCLLYLMTSWEEGHRHSGCFHFPPYSGSVFCTPEATSNGYAGRPEPYYFWLYFVGFNAPWIIIPTSELRISYNPTLHSS